MHYFPKPVAVQARQWDCPDSAADLAEWVGGHVDAYVAGGCGPDGEDWGELTIRIREGVLTVAPFDFVVRTATGSIAVYPPEEFAALFTPADTAA